MRRSSWWWPPTGRRTRLASAAAARNISAVNWVIADDRHRTAQEFLAVHSRAKPKILHENERRRIVPADPPRHQELGIGTQGRPRPHITIAFRATLNLLLLRADETPNLVTLSPLARLVPQLMILVHTAHLAEVDQELGDGVLGDPDKAAGSSNRVALDQAADHVFDLIYPVTGRNCSKPEPDRLGERFSLEFGANVAWEGYNVACAIVDKTAYKIVYYLPGRFGVKMPTTRLSETDHARLQRLARETGQSYQEVLHRALETYERDCFLDALNDSFAKLRADPKAWKDELAERSAWDATSGDMERDS